MPWVSIAMWLLSFLLSKSSGASTGKAAAIATGAALATYYVADPANPDNLLGLSFGEGKTTPGDPNGDTGVTKPAGDGIWSKVVSETGSTLKSWGPTGTLGVIAGTTAVVSDSKKWLPWVIGGVALLLILK